MEKRINPVSEETFDDFLAELGILEECETLALAALNKTEKQQAQRKNYPDHALSL